MAATDPIRRLFTVDEYHRMGEVGILAEDDRVELIDGEIIEMPPIGSRHSSCIARLNRLFTHRLLDRTFVWVQNPLHLSNRSEPVPDLTLLRPREDFYADSLPEPGDALLVVEVSDSTLAFDLRVKLVAYARDQIPELWVVQLPREVISIHRDPGLIGYQTSQLLRRGEGIAPAAFPDLTIAIDDILG